tara:strand:- start:287 stop:547 length:261 start_codon:yes stop_codon:yes gene_type:complete
MATPKTYKQLVKTFKFRDKKPSESPKAYISARGKAMGKEWRKIKADLEKKSAPKKKTTTKKKTATKRKSPAKKKKTTKRKTTRKKK